MKTCSSQIISSVHMCSDHLLRSAQKDPVKMMAAMCAGDDQWSGHVWLDPNSPTLLIVLVLDRIKFNSFTVACMCLYFDFMLKMT